jgi:hypothetical protein
MKMTVNPKMNFGMWASNPRAATVMRTRRKRKVRMREGPPPRPE